MYKIYVNKSMDTYVLKTLYQKMSAKFMQNSQ